MPLDRKLRATKTFDPYFWAWLQELGDKSIELAKEIERKRRKKASFGPYIITTRENMMLNWLATWLDHYAIDHQSPNY